MIYSLCEQSAMDRPSSAMGTKKQTIRVQYFRDPNVSHVRNHRMTMAHLYLREASFTRPESRAERKMSISSDTSQDNISDTCSQQSFDISDTSSQQSSDRSSNMSDSEHGADNSNYGNAILYGPRDNGKHGNTDSMFYGNTVENLGRGIKQLKLQTQKRNAKK